MPGGTGLANLIQLRSQTKRTSAEHGLNQGQDSIFSYTRQTAQVEGVQKMKRGGRETDFVRFPPPVYIFIHGKH